MHPVARTDDPSESFHPVRFNFIGRNLEYHASSVVSLQDDVIKEIGKTNFDVLALQEVWTEATKNAIVSDPTVKAKYPYSYYAPAEQTLAFCSLSIPYSELEDLITSIILSNTDPRTFVQPKTPYDPFTDLLTVGIALRDEQLCLEGLFSTIQGYPDSGKSPFDVINECSFQGCVKYSHGGSPGLLILSKQPLQNVQSVGYETYLERRAVVYATISGVRFAFTQFPYNFFRDIDSGFAYLQPGALQPQMAQDIINLQPDFVVGDFNSGPNYQPEAHNLLVANGYTPLTNQQTYCPQATHESFGPCERTTDSFRSLAIDNIYAKNVPACFTPGTFARTPISDHIGLSSCNTAPVAQADSYSVNQGATLTIAAPGVLQNDTDTDAQNDALTAVKLSNPAHGSVTLNANGSFTYTPTAGYVGTDSFTYQASDGIATSPVTTVTITVQALPQAPKVYAVENKDGRIQFYTITPTTGAASPLGAKQTLDFEDVAVHPTTGVLYASTGGDGSKKGALYRVDMTTGAATLIGSSGFADITVLVFKNDGTLWGWNEGKGLVQLDLATGKGTLVYKKDMKIEGMAWTPNGKLYMARDKYLYEYNPATGKTVEYAKNLLKGTESLDILPDGRLAGGARDGSKLTLFTYNLAAKKVVTTKTVTGSSGFNAKSIEGLSWPANVSLPTGL